MQKKDLQQVWRMFVEHLSQTEKVSEEVFDLISKSTISDMDENMGFVEILPENEMGVHYIKSNLGNSLAEISDYFKRFHGIEKVEIKGAKGKEKERVFISKEKNERREAFLGYLNSRYTFKSFVVGESNNFANAAAMGAVNKPGFHNPLFIRGASGLGKTHLMNAIGNELAKKSPNTNICCLSSEDFANIVVDHIARKNTSMMRTKLRRQCDVLMIDDIQFIEGKPSTLDEFFHTFNALYDAGKQIVLTSDKTPDEMENFEERIKSRFMWGLIADIRPPDIDTRAAIIKKKAEERNVEIPDGVIEMISEKVKNNVRELEGALTKLVIMAQIEGKPIDIRTAHQVLKESAAYARLPNGDGGTEISTEIIKGTVENTFNLRSGQLESEKRTKTISFPRQVAMFLVKKHLGKPYMAIGEEFGNRDHSTVMHSVSKIEKAIEEKDDITVRAVKEVEDRMGV